MLREAIEHYEQALQLRPHVASVENNLAWLLATSRDLSLRDVPRALQLARAAEEDSGGANAVILHTLSAAYVQSGDLLRGNEIAERALQLAEANGDRNVAEILRRELSQIRAHLEQITSP